MEYNALMIHYHGGPITPIKTAIKTLQGRHGIVSFEYPGQLDIVSEVCQSFILDNGAFSAWKNGKIQENWDNYINWIREWYKHPGFDFCFIPDKIDGIEKENKDLILYWKSLDVAKFGVPIWHLHESLAYLDWMVDNFPRIALGSSGEWSSPGSCKWWKRINESMKTICDTNGKPKTKIHGLRMLSPTIYSHIPFSSADSCNLARNIGMDKNWDSNSYIPKSRYTRSLILIERIECHASASVWNNYNSEENSSLLG